MTEPVKIATITEIEIFKMGKYIVLRTPEEFSLYRVAKTIREKIRHYVDRGEKYFVIDLSRAATVESSLIGAVIYSQNLISSSGGSLFVAELKCKVIDAMLRLQLQIAADSAKTEEGG